MTLTRKRLTLCVALRDGVRLHYRMTTWKWSCGYRHRHQCRMQRGWCTVPIYGIRRGASWNPASGTRTTVKHETRTLNTTMTPQERRNLPGVRLHTATPSVLTLDPIRGKTISVTGRRTLRAVVLYYQCMRANLSAVRPPGHQCANFSAVRPTSLSHPSVHNW
jgi:hypothetical protein